MVQKEKNKKKLIWANQQKMMNPPQAFLETLQAYNKEEIQDWQKNEVKELLKKPHFTKEGMLSKSVAAANIANWVINVIKYNDIYVNVKPLQEEAERAEKEANEKAEELRIVQERVAEIVAKVNALKEQLAAAEAKKQEVVDKAEALQQSLDLANRLVNGLADENVRWRNNVETSKQDKLTMIGNSLIAAAFVSYIGPFSSTFRTPLWKDTWIPDIIELKIPFTEGIDPL
jgi:dynein heavy chain